MPRLKQLKTHRPKKPEEQQLCADLGQLDSRRPIRVTQELLRSTFPALPRILTENSRAADSGDSDGQKS